MSEDEGYGGQVSVVCEGEGRMGDFFRIVEAPSGFWVHWWDSTGEHVDTDGPFGSCPCHGCGETFCQGCEA